MMLQCTAPNIYYHTEKRASGFIKVDTMETAGDGPSG